MNSRWLSSRFPPQQIMRNGCTRAANRQAKTDPQPGWLRRGVGRLRTSPAYVVNRAEDKSWNVD